MSQGYARAMKAPISVRVLVLSVLVGSTTFAATPAKPSTSKISFSTLERCPSSVSAKLSILELKTPIQPARALFRGPAQIQPIPPARPLESRICPIPLAK